MQTLAAWLQEQLEARDLTQQAAAVYAGISPATLSEIVNRGHIPKMETLFRLAARQQPPLLPWLHRRHPHPAHLDRTFHQLDPTAGRWHCL